MKLILVLFMKVMTQKMIFSMVFFDEINTPQFSLVKEVKTEMVVISNTKLVKNEVKKTLNQLKYIVLSNMLNL